MSDYFLRAHTSKGYVSFAEDTVKNFKDTIVLSGGSKKLREELLNSLVNNDGQGADADTRYIHLVDGQTLDGISFGRELLILAEHPQHRLEFKDAHWVNLDDCIHSQGIQSSLEESYSKIKETEASVHRFFQEGKAIHEKKEELYLKGMDFSKADQAAEDVIALMFQDADQARKSSSPYSEESLFGGATAFGPVNFIDEITRPLNNRLIIKGRSGSGKSTLMRKVVKHAEVNGLSVMAFPCGLDPDSLDMVVLPDLGFAILDGTAPHVINPSREGDQVIDMFERCMDPEVEKRYENELQELSHAYQEKMKAGTAALKAVLELENEVDRKIAACVDQASFTSLAESLNKKISG
ncbi:hypothetical protein CR205_11995 [Alteribacter lacisalsi]|uniref:Uncharacterized protein n=1 Tax=Alteribacter lacisalsi TaxID=2045244 RepID=A0A2W0H6T2_9BACI|nr:hypothetical protein [Alteribacter lacisalsi]PYZ96436.1 hypothetical protein CR205_11995 [Alteribacter lacisalsi]